MEPYQRELDWDGCKILIIKICRMKDIQSQGGWRCFDCHGRGYLLNSQFGSWCGHHYSDVIIARKHLKTPAPPLFTQPFIQAQMKEISKLQVTGLCSRNSAVTGEFPAQLSSNAEMFPFDDVIMRFLDYVYFSRRMQLTTGARCLTDRRIGGDLRRHNAHRTPLLLRTNVLSGTWSEML